MATTTEILQRALKYAKKRDDEDDSGFVWDSHWFLKRCQFTHFGTESIRFDESDKTLHYINMGDTYAQTVCACEGESWIGSWGDWLEEVEREYCEDENKTKCANCGEFVDYHGEERTECDCDHYTNGETIPDIGSQLTNCEEYENGDYGILWFDNNPIETHATKSRYTRLAIRLQYTAEFDREWSKSVGDYLVELLAVTPGIIPKSNRKSLADSYGMPIDEFDKLDVLAQSQLAIEYGCSACLWQDAGHNLDDLLQAVEKERQANHLFIGFKLDGPQNAIGTSGWDFMRGEITAGFKEQAYCATNNHKRIRPTTTTTESNPMVEFKMIHDNDSESPRDWDNLGTMVCDHRRYNLGDKQGSIADIWSDISSDISDENIRKLCLAIVEHYTEYGRDEYRRYVRDWRDNAYGQTIHDIRRDFCEGFVDNSDSIPEFQEAIESVAVVLPLYLYDHSGITMSTGGFSCPWDSGLVGVIYVSHKRIRDEYGETSDDSIDKATKNLEGEVRTYAQYLEGDIWGYMIEDDEGEHIDSCFGFYGSNVEDNGMLDHIDEKYHTLAKEFTLQPTTNYKRIRPTTTTNWENIMPTTNYAGIDYSFGKSNVDDKGFHFGVISTNDCTEYIWDSVESEYWHGCPNCGTEIDQDDYCADDNCPHCDCEIADGEQWSYEPIANYIKTEGIEAIVDSHNDIMIVKSPYYTHAQFCSPCAPGAGHLANPCPTGPKTYCLGKDWFDNDIAPYPVYDCKTDKLVEQPIAIANLIRPTTTATTNQENPMNDSITIDFRHHKITTEFSDTIVGPLGKQTVNVSRNGQPFGQIWKYKNTSSERFPWQFKSLQGECQIAKSLRQAMRLIAGSQPQPTTKELDQPQTRRIQW